VLGGAYVQPDSADGFTDDHFPKCKPNVDSDGANHCSDGFTDGCADDQHPKCKPNVGSDSANIRPSSISFSGDVWAGHL